MRTEVGEYIVGAYLKLTRVASQLTGLSGLELVINQDYTKKIDELRVLARKTKHDTNNQFFRTLQDSGASEVITQFC